MQAIFRASAGATLLLAVDLPSSSGSAAAAWPPITREEMQLEADPMGSQPAVILFERGGADDRGRERRQTLHRRIKILTPAGVDRAEILISIIEPAQRLEGLAARSVKPNGRETELMDLAALERRANPEGTTNLRFRIPNAAAGDIIEYRYEIVGGALPPLGGWVFQHDIPCLSSRYEWRPGYSLTSHWTLIGAEPWDAVVLPLTSEGSDSLDAVQFEIRGLPASNPESFGPPVIETRPRLVTTYTTIAASPEEYWDLFAAEAAAREDRFCVESRRLSGELSALEGYADDFEGRIRRAYAIARKYLSDDSVAGIDGPPLDETATADSVLAAGSTNHEGVHLLFVAALRALGIGAHRAFVVDRDQAFFHHELQSPAQFSRTVVAVAADSSRAFFFSPGTPFAPPGVIPWYVQGIAALVAGPDGAHFTRTPVEEAAVNRVTRTSRLTLDAAGGGRGIVHVDYAGQAEMSARTALARGNDAVMSPLLSAWRRAIPDLDITDFVPANVDDPSRNLSVDITIRSGRIGRPADDRLLINPADLSRGDNRWPETRSRKEPVFFTYARTETDNFTLAIPREWRIDSVPGLIDFENSAGRYRAIWSFDGENLVYQRTIVLNKALVPIEDLDKLGELLDTVEAGDATLVPLIRVPLRPSERGN